MTVPVLVSLDRVKRRLRMGSDDSLDSHIEDLTAEATDLVLRFIKAEDDDYDEDTVPPRVVSAICLVVKSLFDDSAKAELLKGLAGEDLDNPIVALLYDLRSLTIA